jgi:hypothetical protein
VEGFDIVFVDADFFAPLVEETDPITEVSDFRYFAWHKNLKSLPQGSQRYTGESHRGLPCEPL